MPTDEDALDDPPTAPSEIIVAIEDELIDGRYRLIRELGRGGMSVVHLAEHVDLKRPVALKILRPPNRSEGLLDFTAWFKREARTLASIQHPNVVGLYDFGKLGPDVFFLAMEYLDGPSLARLLKQGPLEPERAIKLIAQACRALRHTHQRGVVHRDVKPSNLIVTTTPEGHELVKVIDFGIAETGEGTEADGEVLVGSPHCIAPEQIERKPFGPAADIYAVGVVLFRTITGKWPFSGPDRRATLMAHLVDTPPSMLTLVPDLQPRELDRIVRKCLQRDPADRYTDMGALIEDLMSLLPEETGTFLTSTLVAPAAPAEEPPAASRVPLGVAAALLSIAVLALVWLALSSGTAPPSAAAVEAPPVAVAPAPVAAPPATAPTPSPVARDPSPPKARSTGTRPRATAPKAKETPTSTAPSKAPGGEPAPQGYKAMPDF